MEEQGGNGREQEEDGVFAEDKVTFAGHNATVCINYQMDGNVAICKTPLLFPPPPILFGIFQDPITPTTSIFD